MEERKMKWLLLFLPVLALADDGDGNDVSNIIETESMSIAAGFGGVEIKDCIYTVQYFIIFQGAKINPLCVADKLDSIGKHKEAAEMRCSIRRYRKPYGNVNQCIRVTQYVPPPPEDHVEQADYEVLQQEVVDLKQQYEEIKEAPPQVIETRTITEQRPWMSEDTRSKLQAILDEEPEK